MIHFKPLKPDPITDLFPNDCTITPQDRFLHEVSGGHVPLRIQVPEDKMEEMMITMAQCQGDERFLRDLRAILDKAPKLQWR